MGLLHSRGAQVVFHDPYVAALEAREWRGDRDLHSTPFSPETLAHADCVVIVTDHRVLDYGAITRHARLIVDSRNAIKTSAPHIFKLGAP
jgi:UDP-N-acetyl-D-glucosamine dehydrogenase